MKRLFKGLFLIIGIILLVIFIFPIAANIFNIGTVVGTAISFCFIFAGIFLDNIISLIKNIRKNKTKRICLNSFFALITVAGLCFATALGAVISYSGTKTENQETVIVLGCAVEGSRPSSQLTDRVNAACKYLRKNEKAVAVLSGGKGDGENISEAECMYDMMIQMGIEKDRLYLEGKSTNTNENIEYSLELIRDNNLSESIAIATSDYHLKRATMIAEKNGIENVGRISASVDLFSAPTFYVRDTLGVIKEFVLG